jgi:hypothetical protein
MLLMGRASPFGSNFSMGTKRLPLLQCPLRSGLEGLCHRLSPWHPQERSALALQTENSP